MEHKIVNEWASHKKIELVNEVTNKLIDFAHIIHEKNKKFNLTGFKTVDEILTELILPSIIPLKDLDVPRGTSFADIGTGAGIPGIVISIIHKNYNGTLIDSNSKKIRFVNGVIKQLNITNTGSICGRLEDIVRDKNLRESFNWVFSRAMGTIPAVLELGIPLLSKSGNLFIYTKITASDLNSKIIGLAEMLGAMPVALDNKYTGLIEKGLLFKKIKSTDTKYPRNFSKIKRESSI